MEKTPSGLAKSSVCSSQGKQTLERIIFPLFHFNTGSSRCLSLTSDAVVVFAQVWQAAELQLLEARHPECPPGSLQAPGGEGRKPQKILKGQQHLMTDKATM